MNTVDKLEALLDLYLHTVGVGHTRALTDGLKSFPGALVMASHMEVARNLFPFLTQRQLLSWVGLTPKIVNWADQLGAPLVMDNSAIIAILSDALEVISGLEVALREAEKEVSRERQARIRIEMLADSTLLEMERERDGQ